jgi:glycerophosphoryl diester phosphodiesterase
VTVNWGLRSAGPAETMIVWHGRGRLRTPSYEEFEVAAALAHALECDAHLCAEGLIAYHPPTRTGLETALDGELISALTQAQIAGRRPGVLPPLIKQILDLTEQAGCARDVEVKDLSVVATLMELLDGYAPESTLITSFLDGALRTAKRHNPQIKTGLLLGLPHADFSVRYSELFPTRRLASCSADLIVPHIRLVQLGVLRRCGGHPALVWGVNTPGAMRACFVNPKVIGFVTDDLETALRVRGSLL